ncbi:MAG: site-2 protease family protein [Methanobacteriaceae archaeon]|nr:site-2 protease family protein [Methanobacteriaceae archaeon]
MTSFSRLEKRDLTITIIVITFLFTYLFSKGSNLATFVLLLPVSFVAVGLSFVLHELGHKYMAQEYGFYAEFKMWMQGLILAIFTAFLGFIFLAPGAVYISAYQITDEQNGKISLAGPIVNIILAIIFLILKITVLPLLTTPDLLTFELAMIILIGFNVNSFLAFFNLLPIPMFDGSKIFKWNKPIWIVVFVTSLLLTGISYTGVI